MGVSQGDESAPHEEAASEVGTTSLPSMSQREPRLGSAGRALSWATFPFLRLTSTRARPVVRSGKAGAGQQPESEEAKLQAKSPGAGGNQPQRGLGSMEWTCASQHPLLGSPPTSESGPAREELAQGQAE